MKSINRGIRGGGKDRAQMTEKRGEDSSTVKRERHLYAASLSSSQ